MQEKKMTIESVPLHFTTEDERWDLNLAKSFTRVKDSRQLKLITEPNKGFVPMKVEEEIDQFKFSFTIDQHMKTWKDIKKLGRNDKLRLLCNVAQFKELLSTRITFFLHPDNIIFDDNLMPALVFRGIRNLVPPFEINEHTFLKQFQCLIIALFSEQYTFDELYHGALSKARSTEFERHVKSTEDLAELISYLQKSYRTEQDKTEKAMKIVPKKSFRLYKQLTVIFVILSLFLAVPLVYIGFKKLPYEEKLLSAQRDFLASDYGGVISTLQHEQPDKLPYTAKYILAYSYIRVEKLSDEEKKIIMNNISLKSDQNYLLYWIYNGKGDFEKSIDLAKYIDDPQLVMYGLIKKIEQDKNNPSLSGAEREELVTKSQDELDKYRSAYDLDEEEPANIDIEFEENMGIDEEDLDVDEGHQLEDRDRFKDE